MEGYSNKKIHFIGIGGVSMSAIANLLIDKGAQVSGSDLKDGNYLDDLRNKGAEISLGHSDDNFDSVDMVVYSSAIPNQNPELQKALKNNIPILQRAEMLAQLTQAYKLIAISGTHGKTTTTGMLATIFVMNDYDPAVMVGGNLDLLSGNYRCGEGEFFITEADESDGSLLFFEPSISVVTNIEAEHLDHYGDEKNLFSTMKDFVLKDSVESSIICIDDFGVKEKLLPLLANSKYQNESNVFITYGIETGDYKADKIKQEAFKTTYNLLYKNNYISEVELNVPGKHNVLNSLAAIAVAKAAGLQWEEIITSLRGFKGVKRRFELKGKVKGITVIDDYAHHPAEIQAVLETANKVKSDRIIVAFQPHRYTRTRDLWTEFKQIISEADVLIISSIYSAGQAPIEGINSKNLAAEISKENPNKQIEFAENIDATSIMLLEIARSGDLIITVGAGDIFKAGEQVIEYLSGEQNV
ncbi:MAG: UDP-N-acetylmuramate--L-alanine ligase [Bacillota bacterium]